MHQTEERDIRKMGGLASKMPFSTVSGMIAALSIAGAPPLACFISEFLIFVGAFQIIQTSTASTSYPQLSCLLQQCSRLAYSLRFISKVFFGQSKDEQGVEPAAHDAHGSHSTSRNQRSEHGHKIVDVPNYMKVALAILGGSGCSNRNLPDVLHESNSNSDIWRTGGYNMVTIIDVILPIFTLIIAALLTIPVFKIIRKSNHKTALTLAGS